MEWAKDDFFQEIAIKKYDFFPKNHKSYQNNA